MPVTSTATKWTRQDAAKLRAAEDVIQTAESWAMEAARALLSIRDAKLWRNTHKTFDSYALDRWHYETAHAYRLCAWAEVISAVSPIGENPPQRESVARPLYGLTADQQVTAWKAATRSNATPTAAKVAEIVQAQLRRPAARQPTGEQQRGTGEIVCADAMDGLSQLDDGSVNLLLFSPPYAMQRKRDYPSIPEHNFPAWMVDIFEAARPKLNTTASIMFIAREHVRQGCISDYLLRTRLALRDAGWCEIDTLIWHKKDAPPTGSPDRPRRAYENIYWFSATGDPFCAPKEIGEPLSPRDSMVRMRTLKSGHHAHQPFARFREDGNARVTDIISACVSGNAAGIDHPAPYPISLCDQLIRTYSPADGLVVDCCCGSGSTLIAARDAGRSYFGFDVVPKYVRLARKRLAQNLSSQ